MHGSSTAYRLAAMPLVIGMPVMLMFNLDVPGGASNGTIGTLKSIRYTIDSDGNRYLQSCVIHSDDVKGNPLPGLGEGDIACFQDTRCVTLTHPYNRKSISVSRRQLPICPAFASTVHKAQGLTLPSAIVDLEGCHGSECPYVMLSRVKNFNSLFILRDFQIEKIRARPSESIRKEEMRLAKLGAASGSSLSQQSVVDESSPSTSQDPSSQTLQTAQRVAEFDFSWGAQARIKNDMFLLMKEIQGRIDCPPKVHIGKRKR
ncbi:hypothetical protein CVT24_001408 [Panaeolus cyanescens]|uniref:ATP-dependent DNA helicase n=1 Tax=Panaeolus cyanescens TaxID=181874 RepID=A0A409WIP7_9AGAR|nr:hypothetical protein CVT24_001408 [Panaeolus cyanescens]